MAKIFLLYSRNDKSFADQLKKGLSSSGHFIISNYDKGLLSNDHFNSLLKDSEVIIPLITEHSIATRHFISELKSSRSYAKRADEALFIPVISSSIGLNEAYEITDSEFFVYTDDTDDISTIVSEIDSAISVFFGHLAAKEEEKEKIDKAVQTNLSDFVTEAIGSQQKYEYKYSLAANLWYAIGYASLVIGFITSIYIFRSLINAGSENTSYIRSLSLTFLNVVAVAILAALARYAYSLGKSYMSEALKCSDRIHAIQFGKFYLRAYGEKSSSSEIREVFQHWNIDRTSTFSSLDTSQVDPQIVTMVVEIVSAIAGKKSR